MELTTNPIFAVVGNPVTVRNCSEKPVERVHPRDALEDVEQAGLAEKRLLNVLWREVLMVSRAPSGSPSLPI